jgi:hypothetical protein
VILSTDSVEPHDSDGVTCAGALRRGSNELVRTASATRSSSLMSTTRGSARPPAFVGRAGGEGWTLIVAPAINAGVIGRGGEIA